MRTPILAGEHITAFGGHPSLKIGSLLETHQHDVNEILKEAHEHEKDRPRRLLRPADAHRGQEHPPRGIRARPDRGGGNAPGGHPQDDAQAGLDQVARPRRGVLAAFQEAQRPFQRRLGVVSEGAPPRRRRGFPPASFGRAADQHHGSGRELESLARPRSSRWPRDSRSNSHAAYLCRSQRGQLLRRDSRAPPWNTRPRRDTRSRCERVATAARCSGWRSAASLVG